MQSASWQGRRWLMAFAIAACVAWVGPVSAAHAAGTVTGTVRDALGTPLDGVEVAVFDVDTANGYVTTLVASGTVDPLGVYSIDVPAGSYLVGARMAPTYPEWQFFTPRRGGNAMNPFTAILNGGRTVVDDGVSVPFIDVRLLEPVFFEGAVTGQASGSPLANIHVGAAVYMPNEGWELIEETVTRPDGTYRLQTVPNADLALMDPPTYVIRFADPAGTYANQVFDGQLYFEAGQNFDMLAGQTTSSVDASLVVGSRITGTVRDALTGAPVPAVSVEVFRYVPMANVWEPVSFADFAVLTDAFGTYNWGGLPPGEYKVKFAGEPGVYGPEFYGGNHVSDPNIVPASATTVTIGSEGQVVANVDGDLDLFDGASPITTLNASNAWQRSPYQVSLSATDQVLPGTGVASGVAYSQYRIPPGAWTNGSTFAVSGEGTIAVQFRSSDTYGNIESAKTGYVRLDATAPSTSSDATNTYVNVATIRLSATDNLSGVASTWARVDGGAPSKLTTVTVFGAGTHTVEYWSVDGAGNTEPADSAQFSITQTPITRTDIQGRDRIASAIAVSRAAYPGGSGKPRAVVLVNANAWADALGAAALAGAVDAPILLVDPARPEAVRPELARLRALGATRAFAVGGPASMPAAAMIPARSVFGNAKVTWIQGGDRYAVSRAVASRTRAELIASGRPFSGTAFVVSGTQPYDALAASPIAASKGYPIILARVDTRGRLDRSTREALTALSIDHAVIVGGTSSLSSTAERELRAQLLNSVVRLSGSDRYATSAVVAQWGVNVAGLNWNRVAVAGGTAFADSLTGSVLQAKRQSVLLTTPPDRLVPAARNALSANAGVIFDVTFLGGSQSLFPSTRSAVIAALR